MPVGRLLARAPTPDAAREAKRIAAARMFTRTAVRLFVMLYITGAVLLLPGVFTSRGARVAASTAQEMSGAMFDDRTALAPHPIAKVDRAEQLLSRTYVVSPADTLDSIAQRFGIKPETVAYNNGITTRAELRADATLRLPSVDGAIYHVQEGDTIDSIAAKFGVGADAVMDANDLYFEPENFGPGKDLLVPVPAATFPGFTLDAVARAQTVARGSAPGAAANVAPSAGQVTAPAAHRLQWPVAGVITQNYSAGHLGVDIAAPYGTPIGASDAGVVSAVGWVPIGGLRVCVTHDWGLMTCYYHTSATYVYVGQRVARGQVVAAIGLTGVTTGPHVHWEANLGGVLVNPLAY